MDRKRDKQRTDSETVDNPDANTLEPEKAAFVAVVGRPSSGKSTLLNALCGAKVSITSPVPQTTRNCIRGIVNRERGQLVFVDTPGIHISNKKFNLNLMNNVRRAISDSDLIVYILDCTRPPGSEEDKIISLLNKQPPETIREKTIALINKVDVEVKRGWEEGEIEEINKFLEEKLPLLPKSRIFWISAKKKLNLKPVLDELFALAPESARFYDVDCYTDQDVRFRICEIVREKTIETLRDELPHSIFVEAESAELKGDELSVRIIIRTERKSQQGIIIGAHGNNIKKIRLNALKELKELFNWKIKLELYVKTSHNWRSNDKIIKSISH